MAVKAINKGLKLNFLPFQLKFACLAGIQALLLASEYAVSQKKPAIVVVADRSIYDDKKAEVTQGSGVVALRIEKNPNLLALNFKTYGQYVEDVDDFKIPINSAPFPKVDGPLTKPAYLKCVLNSFIDFQRKNSVERPLEKASYIVMHTPFPKMVVWASASLWRYQKNKEKDFQDLLDKSVENPNSFSEFKELLDKTRDSSEFQRFLKRKVEPGLRYNSYVGNCYNASVFISLLSVLEQIKKEENILIIGYGSGAGAVTLSAKALKNSKSDLGEQIKNGKELTAEQYREWKNRLVAGLRS